MGDPLVEVGVDVRGRVAGVTYYVIRRWLSVADPDPSVADTGVEITEWVIDAFPTKIGPCADRTGDVREFDAAGPVTRWNGDLTEIGMGQLAKLALVYSVMPTSFSLAAFETNEGPRDEADVVIVDTKAVGAL